MKRVLGLSRRQHRFESGRGRHPPNQGVFYQKVTGRFASCFATVCKSCSRFRLLAALREGRHNGRHCRSRQFRTAGGAGVSPNLGEALMAADARDLVFGAAGLRQPPVPDCGTSCSPADLSICCHQAFAWFCPPGRSQTAAVGPRSTTL